MREYKKPQIIEESIELEDVIASSGPTLNDLFDTNNSGDSGEL